MTRDVAVPLIFRLSAPGSAGVASGVYKRAMNSCEIIAIKHGHSFRWTWRHVAKDGAIKKSPEAYELFYECVSAARKSGYQPNVKCP